MPRLQENAIHAIAEKRKTEGNVQKAAEEEVAVKSVGVCGTGEEGKDVLTQDVVLGQSHPSGGQMPVQQ